MGTHSPQQPMKGGRQFAFARLLGSAVIGQALLSAASFLAGLLLIRYTTDFDYGLYALAIGALMLVTSLQGSFLNPALVARLTPLAAEARRDLVGGLHREQNQMVRTGGGAAFLVTIALWYAGVLDRETGALALATLVTALALLHRNFFRMVLLAYRRPHEVLLGDIAYVVIMVLGVLIAVRTATPAVGAMLAVSIAALLSGQLLAGILKRHEPWNSSGSRGILRAVAPLAAWSAAGAAIHWTFSQGYMYLAAGTLDLTAVAVIMATRMLMMPLNLLSSGIGSMMLPLTAGWLQHHGAGFTLRRLARFASALAGAACCYFLVLWVTRDWLFAHVLQKEFAARDLLLLLWGLAFLPMIVRDQLLYLLVARQRFHRLTALALSSAIVSLVAGYAATQHFGVLGPPLGVVVGEFVNLAGIIVLSLREVAPFRRPAEAAEPGG